ncbi:MAG: hypothetical protein PVH19_05315 [Planctomycetia bacterium]|jgi:hypothetical protein
MKILALWAVLLAAPLSGDDLQQLIQQLDSPKLAEREAAERSLQAAGPRVLPMLPGDETPLSPETEMRIARIKSVLQKQVAADWSRPSRATFEQAEMPLDKLLETLRQQTGNPVSTSQKTGKTPIAAQKLSHQTFWQTLLQIAERHGLRIVTRAGHRSVELAPLPKETTVEERLPIGPLLLTIHEKKGHQQELQIVWEPRLEPIWLKLQLDGPDGTSAGTYELNPAFDTISAELTVPAPSTPAESGLTGSITGLIPGPKQAFRFPLADRDKRKQNFAQVTLELLNVRQEKEELRLALRLRYTQTYDALESYRGWFFDNKAYLTPSKQAEEEKPPKPIKPTGMETDNRTANSIDLIYRFKIDGRPDDYTFTYHAPIALIRIDYHFPKAKPESKTTTASREK